VDNLKLVVLTSMEDTDAVLGQGQRVATTEGTAVHMEALATWLILGAPVDL